MAEDQRTTPSHLDPGTRSWWTLLRVGSVVNVALLLLTAARAPFDDGMHRAQLLLATIYVVVCAFRSFYPRVDLERTVLVDHWLSGIVLGRSAATVAELAFTAQCALFVAHLAQVTGVPGLAPVAWGLVPLIALAQGCCWLGVLTLNHLWHAAEESLWVVLMGLLAAAFVAAWPGSEAPIRALLPLGLLACAGGAFVMAVLDIPMYVRRWRAETAEGKVFLGLGAGLADAAVRRVPTGSWEVWRREVGWMTPYFTVGVWLSLTLVWL